MSTPALLLAGCLMSRLEIEDQPLGSGGDGGTGGSASGTSGSSGASASPHGGGTPNQADGGTSGATGDGGGGGVPDSDGGTPGASGSGGSGGASSGGGGASSGGGGASSGGGGASSGGGGASSGGGGASGGGGTGGVAGGGNSGASGGGTGGVSGSGGSSAGGTGGNGGSGGTQPDPNDPLTVKKSAGCGVTSPLTPGGFVSQTLLTSGTKGADAKGTVGAWQYTRQYYVWLPTGYDKNAAYPLLFQGPGCGGSGNGVYNLNAGLGTSVIRVGLSPPPAPFVHSTNPGQGCFDDHEPKYSVDFVFYEALLDKLKAELCIDEHRVYASGTSSGSFLANQLACRYAGDTSGHALRGVLANTGGLSESTSTFAVACTNQPLAGMWIHETLDATNPFALTKVAVERAMDVNDCTGADYDTAQFDDYPVAGKSALTCKKIRGCPAAYPLVVCELPGNTHGSHDDIAVPGFTSFVNMLSTPPLIKP